MRKRVEETLDLLRLADLRRRPLRELSGGQQQRVAIGAVLTAHPKVLVLDEPTSALDPTSAEDVLATITRLVHDLGITALVAEHRLERVVQYADRVLAVGGRRAGAPTARPTEVLAAADVAPPVVELGRLAGWSPLPLSVRDARRRAGPLLERLASRAGSGSPDVGSAGPPRLRARRVSVRYGDLVAVREVDLELAGGEVVALMGRNGSGKSSLLWALQGAGRRSGGTVDVGGTDPADVPPGAGEVARRAGTPDAERPALPHDRRGGVRRRPTRSPAVDPGACLRPARAARRTGRPGAAPARSLRGPAPRPGPGDPARRGRARSCCSTSPPVAWTTRPRPGSPRCWPSCAAAGRAVVCSTHDVEFVATAASRVVVLADGEVVADGPTADVVVSSPAFAPQVAKVLAPQAWLTVAEVARGTRRAVGGAVGDVTHGPAARPVRRPGDRRCGSASGRPSC